MKQTLSTRVNRYLCALSASALICMLLAAGAALSAPVEVDTVTAAVGDSASFTHSHTIESDGRLLLVAVQFVDDGDSSQTVTFGGSPLSLVGSVAHSSGKPRIELWQLWVAATDTSEVVVTIADGHSAKAAIAAVSLAHVDPADPIDTCITKQAKSTSGSIVIASEQADLVLSGVVSLANGEIEPSILTTTLWSTEVASGNFGLGFSKAGANSINIGWALPESKEWAAFAANINHLNLPPVITPVGDTSIVEGDLLEFTISAVDEDGTIPALTAVDLPVDAKFKDNGDGTGAFEFQSPQTGAGIYEVIFIADDGVLADTLHVTITVTAENVPPVLAAIGPQSVALGGTLNFDITATDGDGTTPVLSSDPPLANAVLTDDGDGTGSYAFTPDGTQLGAHAVTFIAGDGLLADSETVQITVIDTTQLAYIRIELESGEVVGDSAMSTDDNLSLYCRGYMADDSPLGDVAVNWTVIGADSIAASPVDSAASVVLDLTHPGTGLIVAEYAVDLVDSTGLITCSAGLPASFFVTPDTYTLELGDTIQFSVASFDADSNVTEAGQLTWYAMGHIGEIDATGLFFSTLPGTGRVAVATDLSAAVDTTGPLVAQAIYVSPIALGTTTVHAGDDRSVMLAFSIANYYESSKTINSLTIRNASLGAGSNEEIAGNFDSVALYLDRDLSYDLSLWDTLIAETEWGTGMTYSTPCALEFPPGDEQTILVTAGISAYPHDGDSLDFILVPSTDMMTSDLTVADGPDTVDSYGYGLIDGMTAGQIALTGGAPDTISWLDGPVRVLSLDIPRNGYSADVLTSISVSNHGSAVADDVDSMMLYVDNGDAVWDGGALDVYAARLMFSGYWWTRSDLAVPLDSQTTRLYVVAAASRFASRGATLQLGVPQFGLAVASQNDGPLDEDVLPVGTVTITSERELSVEVTSLAGGSIAWGSVTAPLLSLQLTNHSGDATEVDSLVITSYASALSGATQAELDGQFDSLLLYHDLDGTATSIGGADTLIGSVILSDGRGSFATPGLLLLGGNGSMRLAVAAVVSESNARDGNTVRFGLAASEELYCTPSITVTGDFPAVNPNSFTITGFPAASVGLPPIDDLKHLGGQINCTLFRFTLPGNGYAADTLEALRLANQGMLDDAEALHHLRLWRDLTGDGYTPDDTKLADFVLVGSEWIAASMAAPVSTEGMTLVVTADIEALSFQAGTFSPVIPAGGVTYRSGLNGPDDAAIISPYPVLIMPADRITVISLSESGAAVSPGADNVPILAFALYNGYSSDKSLGGLSLNNLTKSNGDADYIDQELGQVRLYDDPLASRQTDSSVLMASGFFSDGYLQFDGFESVLPSESLAYFFVAANVADNATDSDTLIVSVPNSAGFAFGEPLSVNGDLPLLAGRPVVVDGSVASQYTVLPLASKTVRPGDTALLIMAFKPAGNGILTDLLDEVSVTVSGAAGPSDLPNVRLWLDRNGDNLWQPTDSLLGLMSYDVDRWTLSSLNLTVDSTPPAVFVVVDVDSSVASGQILAASVPVNGCAFASDNDGPRDVALSSGASFVIYASLLQVSGLDMRQTYSIGETIPVRFTVQNLFATSVSGVTCEIILSGDTSAAQLDSCSAAAALDPGESIDLACYYTAVQAGQLSWAMRAVAASLPDSSAYINTSQVTIQAQPTAAVVDLLNSAPASVTTGQRNVFPLTISVIHPDTGVFAAALEIEGVRLTVRDASGATQPANQVFSRMALGADFSNYAVAYPVPSNDTVLLTFANPVIVGPGLETQLALLVDIDSTSLATSFVLSLDSPDALIISDHNNGLPALVMGLSAFPMTTAASRVDLPSRYLAVSGSSAESRLANLGQPDVVVAGILLRHPSDSGGSSIQLTQMTMEFVDTSDFPLTASSVVSRLALTSLGIEWGAVSGTPLDSNRIAIELSAPITLGPGESRLMEVVCRIDPAAAPAGFRIVVPDSTCLLVREIGSGATLPAATDTDVLVTSSAFPITGAWIDISAPAMEPRLCLIPELPSSIVAGTDSVTLLNISLVYPDCPDCSPLQIEGILMRALDSVGVPLDPQRIFDRIGISINSLPLSYQPYVDLIQGDVHFLFGDTGLMLAPGDSVMVRLAADFESAPDCDNLVLMIGGEYNLAIQDAADTLRLLGVAPDMSCPLEFPFSIGPAAVIQPAGRPNVAASSGDVVVAFQGQAGVPLLDLDIDYSQIVAQGDLQLDGLSGTIYKRTTGGLSPIDASALVSAISLWIEDTLTLSLPVTGGPTLSVSLAQPVSIASGSRLPVRLVGDISTVAERGNYVFVLEDSASVVLRDLMLGASMFPLSAGDVFPLYGVELSVTGATLAESFTNYPNPFVPAQADGTTIAYVLPEPARVSIAIFTITGDLVVDLISDVAREAGEHQDDRWFGQNGNGKSVIPGTYICRITAKYSSGRAESLQRKVAVIR